MDPYPNEYGPIVQCACGCGTSFPTYSKWGTPRRYVHGHHVRVRPVSEETRGKLRTAARRRREANPGQYRGANSNSWKGGRFVDSAGYVEVHCPEHSAANCRGYVYEHRLVMERLLGRVLLPNDPRLEKNLDFYVKATSPAPTPSSDARGRPSPPEPAGDSPPAPASEPRPCQARPGASSEAVQVPQS